MYTKMFGYFWTDNVNVQTKCDLDVKTEGVDSGIYIF